MTGTIVVHAAPPLFRRAGNFTVVIDDVRVGHVKQGTAALFPVPPGTHTVRIAAKDRTSSNTVTVDIAESQDFLVTTRSTGLAFALALPPVVAIGVPPIYAVAAVLLLGAVFFTVPGLLFRARPEGAPTPPPPAPTPEETTGTGLWWESDPNLAKRFRKSSDA